jgi:hypothetical protein
MTKSDVSYPSDEVTTAHFRCECGHQWQREMYDGLVQVRCPNCGRSHLTTLGRVFLPTHAKAEKVSE